jgi:hypothetical protein
MCINIKFARYKKLKPNVQYADRWNYIYQLLIGLDVMYYYIT